jgi:hypothetical protein
MNQLGIDDPASWRFEEVATIVGVIGAVLDEVGSPLATGRTAS